MNEESRKTSALETAKRLGPGWNYVFYTGPTGTSREQSTAFCEVLKQNTRGDLVGIVGAETSPSATFLAPILETHHLPLVSPSATSAALSALSKYPFFARLMPPDNYQALALITLIKQFSFKRIAVLFALDDYSTGLANLVLNEAAHAGIVVVYSTSISSHEHVDYKPDLLTLQRSQAVRIIVVLASAGVAAHILAAAQELGISNDQYEWILSDSATTRVQPLNNSLGVNHESNLANKPRSREPTQTVLPRNSYYTLADRQVLVGDELLPLPHKNMEMLRTVMAGRDYLDYSLQRYGWGLLGTKPARLATYGPFAADAVTALAKAVQAAEKKDRAFKGYNLTKCELSVGNPWDFGSAVMEELREVRFQGESGWVDFKPNTATAPQTAIQRYNLDFEFVNYQANGTKYGMWEAVGLWNNSTGTVYMYKDKDITWSEGESLLNKPSSLKGRHLIIATTEWPPWTVYTRNSNERHKWDSVTGLLVEAIAEISRTQDFTYELHFVTDVDVEDLTRLVGSGHTPYDLLLSPIPITPDDLNVAGFTQPVDIVGTRMALKAPQYQTALWGLFAPFSTAVWVILAGCVVVAGHLFWCYEAYHNSLVPRSYIAGAPVGVWLAITTILQYQDIAPVTASGRLLVAALYYLSVACIAIYTANLVAFISSDGTNWLLEDISQIKQLGIPGYRIGLQNLGSMKSWWLREFPDVFPVLYEKDIGLAAVLNGTLDIAVAADSWWTETQIRKLHCGLVLHGPVFNLKGYHLAVPKGFPGLNAISSGFLNLVETHFFEERRTIYLPAKCPAQDMSTKKLLTSLTVHSMGGVFIIFACAILFACLWYFMVDKLIHRRYAATKRRVLDVTKMTHHQREKYERQQVIIARQAGYRAAFLQPDKRTRKGTLPIPRYEPTIPREEKERARRARNNSEWPQPWFAESPYDLRKRPQQQYYAHPSNFVPYRGRAKTHLETEQGSSSGAPKVRPHSASLPPSPRKRGPSQVEGQKKKRGVSFKNEVYTQRPAPIRQNAGLGGPTDSKHSHCTYYDTPSDTSSSQT